MDGLPRAGDRRAAARRRHARRARCLAHPQVHLHRLQAARRLPRHAPRRAQAAPRRNRGPGEAPAEDALPPEGRGVVVRAAPDRDDVRLGACVVRL